MLVKDKVISSTVFVKPILVCVSFTERGCRIGALTR